MADEETFGLDDELPTWAEDDLHGVPDDPADADEGAEEAPFEDLDRGAPGARSGSRVTLLEQGTVKYFSQRVTRPPMADCMFAALCTPLSFMGYGVSEHFVGELRKASGVPLFDSKGKPQGTTTAASRKALKKLIPDAPVMFGGLPDEDMLERIAAGKIVVRVVVNCSKLPPGPLRRFVGSYPGLHAVAIGGARKRDGDGQWEVLWMDPAGPRKNYAGEFVRYASVKATLKRTPEGTVAVTYGRKNAALPQKKADSEAAAASPSPHAPKGDSVKILTRGTSDEFAHIKKGTPFLHPETGERVTRAVDDEDFRLAGRSLDGHFAGVWVATSKVPGTSGPTLLLVEVSRIGQPFIRSA